MPRTVAEGFDDFLIKLRATPVETEGARSHRDSIQRCLANEYGYLKRFCRIGSFGNGTSVAGFSDIDYLAVLPGSVLTTNSAYSMSKVRDALAKRFWATEVRIDCPAIALPFGTVAAEHTEIVIADYVSDLGGFPTYDIPDCQGGWMRASPDAHNHYVNEQDLRLDRRVKSLIRFIKAWKYLRSVPISSFYLEMRVAKYCETEKTILYEHDVRRVFKMLWDCQLADMRDPMGITGSVPACKTAIKRADALSKLQTAFTRSDNAIVASSSGRVSDAFDWWRLVFDYTFPTYYW
jgi:hypothetical protein